MSTDRTCTILSLQRYWPARCQSLAELDLCHIGPGHDTCSWLPPKADYKLIYHSSWPVVVALITVSEDVVDGGFCATCADCLACGQSVASARAISRGHVTDRGCPCHLNLLSICPVPSPLITRPSRPFTLDCTWPLSRNTHSMLTGQCP